MTFLFFFFLDFAIWTVLVFWIRIKFNVYDLTRDEYSLYGNVSVSFRPPYLCSGVLRGTPTWLASKNLGSTFLRIPRKRKNRTDLNLSKTFCISVRFLNLFISTQVSKLAKKQIKQAENIQLSMEMTLLLKDNSEDTASTSYHLGDEVWKKSARRAKRF